MEKDNMCQQIITLQNRERLTAEQVENVDSFSEEEIILKTKFGGMEIKGKDLKLSDFSVEKGDIILEGKIDSVIFVNIKEKRGFLKGLLK